MNRSAKGQNVKRFERINGLDTALYKTYLDFFTWFSMCCVYRHIFYAESSEHEDWHHRRESLASKPINTCSMFTDTTSTPSQVNMKTDITVASLSLLLNKSDYELARANISGFTSQVSLRNGNISVKGQLASMSLRDESPHARLYRERFITSGSQALNFEFFKWVCGMDMSLSCTLECPINVPVCLFISRKIAPYTGPIWHYIFNICVCTGQTIS